MHYSSLLEKDYTTTNSPTHLSQHIPLLLYEVLNYSFSEAARLKRLIDNDHGWR